MFRNAKNAKPTQISPTPPKQVTCLGCIVVVRQMGHGHCRTLSPPRHAQKKFILVTIDYFTKWVEVEALATITAWQVQNFFWKIIRKFGLPQTVVTDNDRQFIDKKLASFYQGLRLKHVTSSVEHP